MALIQGLKDLIGDFKFIPDVSAWDRVNNSELFLKFTTYDQNAFVKLIELFEVTIAELENLIPRLIAEKEKFESLLAKVSTAKFFIKEAYNFVDISSTIAEGSERRDAYIEFSRTLNDAIALFTVKNQSILERDINENFLILLFEKIISDNKEAKENVVSRANTNFWKPFDVKSVRPKEQEQILLHFDKAQLKEDEELARQLQEEQDVYTLTQEEIDAAFAMKLDKEEKNKVKNSRHQQRPLNDHDQAPQLSEEEIKRQKELLKKFEKSNKKNGEENTTQICSVDEDPEIQAVLLASIKVEAKKPEAKKPEAKKPEAKKPEAKKPEGDKKDITSIKGDALRDQSDINNLFNQSLDSGLLFIRYIMLPGMARDFTKLDTLYKNIYNFTKPKKHANSKEKNEFKNKKFEYLGMVRAYALDALMQQKESANNKDEKIILLTNNMGLTLFRQHRNTGIKAIGRTDAKKAIDKELRNIRNSR